MGSGFVGGQRTEGGLSCPDLDVGCQSGDIHIRPNELSTISYIPNYTVSIQNEAIQRMYVYISKL